MLRIKILDACIEIHVADPGKLESSLKSEFAKRYLPAFRLSGDCSTTDSTIYWLKNGDFEVLTTSYSEHGRDIYVVKGDPPEPYVNESPIFFILQVLARSLAKKGLIMLTDSVVISSGNKNVLLLGFPHTGKSTMASIAVSRGYDVYSTENTVVKIEEKKLIAVNGTRVLVFDPAVRSLFGVNIPRTNKTRHGYDILDLDQYMGNEFYEFDVAIDEIYVTYTSFSSTGASIVPVKGRKIDKLLWIFATSIIRGLDYYQPRPLDTPLDGKVLNTLTKFISEIRENYAGRIYEAFGSPLEVLKVIFS